MGSGAVPGGEAFSRHDESCCVRAEVEEELAHYVACQQTLRTKLVVRESDDDEQDREEDESHELNGLAANGINGRDGHPVARDGTSAHDYEIANSSVVEDLRTVSGDKIYSTGKITHFEDVVSASIANLLEND